jgi:hypothetical protein
MKDMYINKATCVSPRYSKREVKKKEKREERKEEKKEKRMKEGNMRR